MDVLIADANEATASEFVDPIQEARERLSTHGHFHGRVHRFEFMKYGQVLLVRGQVPSFYLKQLLQTALHGVAGIKRIENRVDVICSDGLSSVRLPSTDAAAPTTKLSWVQWHSNCYAAKLSRESLTSRDPSHRDPSNYADAGEFEHTYNLEAIASYPVAG